ncbi:MAG TPA: response regulator [Longimicrobiales bacterium]|nr:response regulator [Longimicrobiales bacterium]
MVPSAVDILLVEDDSLLRRAFSLLLQDAGYRVREAGTAAAAIAEARTRAPAMVLLDMGLPDRPGLEVVRELRAMPSTARVPIAALTGRFGYEDEMACREAGCTHFFPKPIEPRELIRRLPAILEAPAGGVA